ncbi:MAG: CDP-alcohol phosphatidyltransferase family protein [Xenococcaceae cyanobacterium]
MPDISLNEQSETYSEVNQVQTGNSIVVPRSFIDKIIQFFTVRLARSLVDIAWITPNLISLLSCGLGGPAAGWVIVQGNYLIAVLLIAVSGILDSLDGDLARERGVASSEGNILDSVLDRYVDFFLISALILVSPSDYLILGLLALLGATMVPYIRAKSEAQGKSTVATIGSRGTRTIVIIVGLLTGQIFLLFIALAVISNIAAIHRLIFALIPRD